MYVCKYSKHCQQSALCLFNVINVSPLDMGKSKLGRIRKYSNRIYQQPSESATCDTATATPNADLLGHLPYQFLFSLHNVAPAVLHQPSICNYSRVFTILVSLLSMVTVGKFCFNFSRVLGGVVDCVNVNPSAHAHLNHGLRDAQNVCALVRTNKSRHRP